MKKFNEFRTNESVDEGKTYSDGGKNNADYYMTDNQSSVSFSVPYGTLLVSLNGPRDMGTKTSAVAKTKKEMDKIQKLMFKLYKSNTAEAANSVSTIETKVTQTISSGNVRMGNAIEQAEKQFEKKLLRIIVNSDAAIAGNL